MKKRSALVGEKGKVIGVDMTKEQLEVARKHSEYHSKQFNLPQVNTNFLEANIEDLKTAGIESNSVDVVVSNSVINLCADKQRVFAEIFRVLKPGGELLFSDISSDRRVPSELREDPTLWGEGLSGALYTEDFRRIAQKAGFNDVRVVSKRYLAVQEELQEKVKDIKYFSITRRAFKLHNLEDRCEDFGQVAVYKGGIEGEEDAFGLDDHHLFKKGEEVRVCGNTAEMLSSTRFSHFFHISERGPHKGLFDCSPSQDCQRGEKGGSCC